MRSSYLFVYQKVGLRVRIISKWNMCCVGTLANVSMTWEHTCSYMPDLSLSCWNAKLAPDDYVDVLVPRIRRERRRETGARADLSKYASGAVGVCYTPCRFSLSPFCLCLCPSISFSFLSPSVSPSIYAAGAVGECYAPYRFSISLFSLSIYLYLSAAMWWPLLIYLSIFLSLYLSLFLLPLGLNILNSGIWGSCWSGRQTVEPQAAQSDQSERCDGPNRAQSWTHQRWPWFHCQGMMQKV